MPDAMRTAVAIKRSQPLSVQPGMLKAPEDALETGAETGEPTWLAYLTSWMQSMANLQLGDMLRRSFPVERFENWMLLFCKCSKQKHNRSGFYWGVPSNMSTGYDCTFLGDYDTRRKGEYGKEMMGMIFRTDTHHPRVPLSVSGERHDHERSGRTH